MEREFLPEIGLFIDEWEPDSNRRITRHIIQQLATRRPRVESSKEMTMLES